MVISIDAQAIEPSLSEAIAPAMPATLDSLADGAVDALTGGSSRWPVGTGFSKASFGTEIRGDTVVVTNSAVRGGFPYPVVVEARTGAAADTLADAEAALVKQADRAVEDALNG
ncbi:MAG: hypothetical protein OXE50_02170 [Chloroflexi bacterium]|nr:hypothetical protein [Chloroflexota bacterium]